jgi:hypothetical protein
VEKEHIINYLTIKEKPIAQKHKTLEMIDGNYTKCIIEGCKTRPCYNIKGEKDHYIAKLMHLNKMVNVSDKRCSLCDMIYLASKKKFGELCYGCYCYTYPDDPIIQKPQN